MTQEPYKNVRSLICINLLNLLAYSPATSPFYNKSSTTEFKSTTKNPTEDIEEKEIKKTTETKNDESKTTTNSEKTFETTIEGVIFGNQEI